MKQTWIAFLSAICLLLAIPAAHADDYDDFAEDDYAVDYLSNNRGANDPIEPVNRGIHHFNWALDQAILRPVSVAYKYSFPEVARDRVTLFLDNLEAPAVFANSILQGDAQNTFVTFWRFVFNSTFGVLGLFDIATEFGVPPRNSEDFGQTMGVWGVGTGPYLVLPFLGPSNLRDAVGIFVNSALNPFSYGIKDWERFALIGTRAIDARTQFGTLIDNTYEQSLDPYSTFRSLYLQRRKALVRNQNPSMAEQPMRENFSTLEAF